MSFVLLGILNSQAAGAGAEHAYDLLETVNITSDTNSVNFTGLDSYTDYKHLQLRIVNRPKRGANVSKLSTRFNNDSGNNYYFMEFVGNSSGLNQTWRQGTEIETSALDTSDEDFWTPVVIDLLDFSDANKYTTMQVSTFQQSLLQKRVGLWDDTAAVTTINLFGENADFNNPLAVAGSRFSLYGIRG